MEQSTNCYEIGIRMSLTVKRTNNNSYKPLSVNVSNATKTMKKPQWNSKLMRTIVAYTVVKMMRRALLGTFTVLKCDWILHKILHRICTKSH